MNRGLMLIYGNAKNIEVRHTGGHNFCNGSLVSFQYHFGMLRLGFGTTSWLLVYMAASRTVHANWEQFQHLASSTFSTITAIHQPPRQLSSQSPPPPPAYSKTANVPPSTSQPPTIHLHNSPYALDVPPDCNYRAHKPHTSKGYASMLRMTASM